MKDIDISIIIPAYNIELEIIHRCLDSVKGIAGFTYEIILVNDGSEELYRNEYQKLGFDSAVKLINLDKNVGVSEARNKGISASNGKYLMFLDADDVLKPSVLLDIKDLVYDVYFFNIEFINGRHKWVSDEEKYVPDGVLTSQELLEYFAYTLTFHGAVAKLIRSDVIKNNNIKFDPTMVISEDAIFCYNVLKKCHTCFHVNKNIYTYYTDDSHIETRVLKDPEGRLRDKMRLFKVKFGIIENLNGNSKSEKIRALYKRYIDELFDLAIILAKEKANKDILEKISKNSTLFGELRTNDILSDIKAFLLENRLWTMAKLLNTMIITARRIKA